MNIKRKNKNMNLLKTCKFLFNFIYFLVFFFFPSNFCPLTIICSMMMMSVGLFPYHVFSIFTANFSKKKIYKNTPKKGQQFLRLLSSFLLLSLFLLQWVHFYIPVVFFFLSVSLLFVLCAARFMHRNNDPNIGNCTTIHLIHVTRSSLDFFTFFLFYKTSVFMCLC